MKINILGITANNFRAANPQKPNQPNQSKGTSPLEKSPLKDTFEISIGYVNDTHGQTNNMMRILSGIEGDIVLSAGDNDIGDEKNQEVHKATAKFLNIANVIATAVGNHEMDTTQEDLIESIKSYKADALAVNMVKEMVEDPNRIYHSVDNLIKRGN